MLTSQSGKEGTFIIKQLSLNFEMGRRWHPIGVATDDGDEPKRGHYAVNPPPSFEHSGTGAGISGYL